MGNSVLQRVNRRLAVVRARVDLKRPINDEILNRSATHFGVPLILSMTTFSARFDAVWKTLHSLSQQTVKPARVLLVVAEADYLSASTHPSISPYLGLGVELIADHGDRRSYKKLLPALERYPDSTVVTVDDDVLYPRTWLELLVSTSYKNPNYIVGRRGTRIVLNGGDLGKYSEWPPLQRAQIRSSCFSPVWAGYCILHAHCTPTLLTGS